MNINCMKSKVKFIYFSNQANTFVSTEDSEVITKMVVTGLNNQQLSNWNICLGPKF